MLKFHPSTTHPYLDEGSCDIFLSTWPFLSFMEVKNSDQLKSIVQTELLHCRLDDTTHAVCFMLD